MNRKFLLAALCAWCICSAVPAQEKKETTDWPRFRGPNADGVAPDMTSSMHHDLKRGNRLELPWLSGAVVELGAKAGVATPLNRAVRDILALHADGPAAPQA